MLNILGKAVVQLNKLHLDIDDIGRGTVIRDESELLLNLK